ncbi:MAG: CRISPR-associated endonuclease Cas2 [Candidatus Daviesbacteria bacterium]
MDKKVLTKDVLKVLAIGGLVVSTLVVPSLPVALGYVYKKWRDVNKRDLGIIIKRLERQEMIAISEKGRKTKIEITEKGKRRLLEYDFENLQLKAKKRDGKWRLIIFDIPEDKKGNRDALRRKLLQLGCIRLQDSVFACAFPCKKEIDFLSHYLDISDFVTLVSVDKIERGEKLLFKEYGYNDWL